MEAIDFLAQKIGACTFVITPASANAVCWIHRRIYPRHATYDGQPVYFNHKNVLDLIEEIRLAGFSLEFLPPASLPAERVS